MRYSRARDPSPGAKRHQLLPMDFQVPKITKGACNVGWSRVDTGASDYEVGVLRVDMGAGYLQVGVLRADTGAGYLQVRLSCTNPGAE